MYTNSHHQAAQRPPSDKNFSIIKIKKKIKNLILVFVFLVFPVPFHERNERKKKRKYISISCGSNFSSCVVIVDSLFSSSYFYDIGRPENYHSPVFSPLNNSNTYIVVVPERGNFHP